MLKEAVILAGGFGTRLQSVVADVPKPMAPVNSKPFLEYLLNYALNQGIQHVVLSTGYKHEVIENYFGNSYKSLSISYAQETSPLGTGGGIQLALKKCTEKNVVVLNGDSFFEVDLNALEQKHLAAKSEFSIAAKKMFNFNRYGILQTNGSRIIAFEEKREVAEGLINAGVYIIDREQFLALNLAEKFSMEKDYMERFFTSHQFNAFEFEGYFIDIGIPEDYEKAQRDFK
ncbi:MAG: nucleotidyltransferase family protein [Bacteroidetes bacterium]|nr:nucleotidyltransferase family protein [Bacteroidota bacterium]